MAELNSSCADANLSKHLDRFASGNRQVCSGGCALAAG